MRISVLNEIPDDPELREQWNALAWKTQAPQVFYTYEWARAVQLAYGKDLCPLLVLARDEDEQLAGVAALAGAAGRPVTFLCATTGDYCDFVVSGQDAAEFTAQVIETLRGRGCRDVVLSNFPADSPAYAALRDAARAGGFQVFARTAYVCAQVRVGEIAVEDGMLALPRQKMVRRSLRAMGGEAPLAVQHEAGWEEVRKELPEFFRAHVARFLFTERISNLVRPERREFLRELARVLAPSGWLCLSRMSVVQNSAGPRSVAWNYGFRYGATWFWYQPTFVNDLEKYSPGFVLLSKLIEEAAKDAAATVDLGLGAEAYKEAFANATRHTLHVTLHRSRLKHWKEIARYRAAAAIKARPRAERAVRELLGKVDALKRRVRERGIARTVGWLGSRMRSWIFSREEVFFLEAGAAAGESGGENSLRPVSCELLADAAMQFCDDEQTMQYLMRATKRLREGSAEGFALVDGEGRLLHFAWVTNFDGFFLSELNAKVDAPSSECVMIFDCWTAASSRGHGYYGEAVGLIARRFREGGKVPWIFSAASNAASVRGLAKAGVQKRYSLVRQRVMGWQTIKGKTPRSAEKFSSTMASRSG